MWTEYASIFFIFSQTKQFSTQKSLGSRQTVFEKPADSFKLAWFTLPDSFKIPWNSCQTVLIFFGFLFTPALNGKNLLSSFWQLPEHKRLLSVYSENIFLPEISVFRSLPVWTVASLGQFQPYWLPNLLSEEIICIFSFSRQPLHMSKFSHQWSLHRRRFIS